MATKYPGAIDGYAEIRVVRDRIDEIVAKDHNDIRSAVVAIEQTLGINPQGAFGTVVARFASTDSLLSSLSTILDAHLAGVSGRHDDSNIDAIAKTSGGSSLTEGTVRTQLQELLDAVEALGSATLDFLTLTDTPANYAGHASKNVRVNAGETGLEFVAPPVLTTDFTSLTDTPGSYVGQASKNVRVNPGETALEFFVPAPGVTDFTNLADTPANYVGAANKAVTVNAGATGLEFTDTSTELLSRALDTFVVEGLAVTNNGAGLVNVAPGFVQGNGQLVSFAGATALASTDAATNYVAAQIVGGSVVITVDTLVAPAVGSAVNSKVLLHTFARTGAVWTTETDLRRYGMLVNNKNYFTVGDAVAGDDGYGADFTSLKSAVEHVKLIASSGTKMAPKKIMLVNDLTISTAAEMAIPLDVAGLDIDGAGRKVFISVDLPLFNVEASDIRIHDIHAEFDLAGSTTACLAKLGEAGSVARIHIHDCVMTEDPGPNGPAAYFIRCGNAAGTNIVTECVFSDNNTVVRVAGINLLKPSGTFAEVVNNSVITGNRFKSAFAATPEACIRVGDFCVVDGNIIEGGFNTGVELEFSESGIISNNLINGGTGTKAGAGTPFMVTGIGVRTSGAGFASRCMIAGNIVKGITTVGIDDRIAGSGANVMISNNMIDNVFDNSNTMVGIQGRGVETHIIGNMILDAGDRGIENSSICIGNQIMDGLATMVSAIETSVGAGDVMVSNNLISNCPGIGIDLSAAPGVVCSDNLLAGTGTSTGGIFDIGEESVVTGNIIKAYGNSSNYGIKTDVGVVSGIVVADNLILDAATAMPAGIGLSALNTNIAIVGNVIGQTTAGIALIGIDIATANRVLVAGNYVTGNGIFNLSGGGIMGAGNFCVVSGNVVDNPSNIGIDLEQDQSIAIGNIIIGATSNGITAGDIYQSVIGNHIYSPSGWGIRAFSTTGNSLFANNYMWQPSSGGIINESGANNMFAGNYILAPTGIAIEMNGIGCDQSAIVSNYINGVSASMTIGIQVDTGSSGLLVSGNYVDDPSGFGIECAASECSITDNYVVSAGTTGISLDGGTAGFIASNYVESSTGDGIKVTTAPGSAVVGNYVNGCVNGIQTFSTASPLLVQGNFINNHTGDAIEASGAPDQTFVGNMNANPGALSDGIGMTSTADSLCVGNHMVVTGANTGFDFLAGQVTIVGNLMRGGTGAPAGFGAAHSTVGSNRLP